MVDSDDDDDVTSMTLISSKLEEHNNLKIKISYNQNFFNWWRENETKYSVVSLLAKKYLIVVSTSVPCKRLLSKVGTVILK